MSQERCPICGDALLETREMGYVQCFNVVVVGYRPPAGAPPWLPLPPEPVMGVCGHRFRSPSWLRRRARLLLGDEPGALPR